MARNPSVQAGTDAWATGVSNSGAKLEAGVNRVTESPTVTAAKSIPLYLNRVQEAVSSGRLERALLNSPLSDWKTGMMTKAKAGLAGAANRGKSKYSQFAASFYPAMAQASQIASGIDKSTREGQLARVAASLDASAAWKQSH